MYFINPEDHPSIRIFHWFTTLTECPRSKDTLEMYTERVNTRWSRRRRLLLWRLRRTGLFGAVRVWEYISRFLHHARTRRKRRSAEIYALAKSPGPSIRLMCVYSLYSVVTIRSRSRWCTFFFHARAHTLYYLY